jgi:hypothetical protein
MVVRIPLRVYGLYLYADHYAGQINTGGKYPLRELGFWGSRGYDYTENSWVEHLVLYERV